MSIENKKKKLFVFDLDGTLLNKDSKISTKNIEALTKAKKAGHLLVMATGRNYNYTKLVVNEQWGMFDYWLGCNAGIMHDIKNREYTSCVEKIDYDFLLEINDDIIEEKGTIQASTDWDVFVGFYSDKEDTEILRKGIKEKYFDPFPTIYEMSEKDKNSIILVSVHLDEHKVREYQSKWMNLYGDKYEFAITSRFNIDINPKGISKLMGIKNIVAKEQIEYDHVFVFGDTQNDLHGLSYYNNTYAMGNALPEVKKAAKHIIGDNESDDIAKTILKNI